MPQHIVRNDILLRKLNFIPTAPLDLRGRNDILLPQHHQRWIESDRAPAGPPSQTQIWGCEKRTGFHVDKNVQDCNHILRTGRIGSAEAVSRSTPSRVFGIWHLGGGQHPECPLRHPPPIVSTRAPGMPRVAIAWTLVRGRHTIHSFCALRG